MGQWVSPQDIPLLSESFLPMEQAFLLEKDSHSAGGKFGSKTKV